MKIVIAPDKFKGCLGAVAVCDAIAAGLRQVDSALELDLCPMADGGEGTVDALVAATGGRLVTRTVTGPLPEMKVDATFGILGDGETAIVEMAAASGIALLDAAERDPMATTTYGTGELLVEAARLGVKRIILGIGGSATIDGGLGCAQACGLPIILSGGEPVSPGEPLTGRDMDSVIMVKHGRGSAVERVQLIVACDVAHPLYGPDGAAPVFGPQKGATPLQVAQLDESLRALAGRLGRVDAALTPGAGAAGGLGFGMLAFFGAALRPGIELVIAASNLDARLRGADLCLTGEGRLDEQSLWGKTAIGVARRCREAGVPCIAIAGSIDWANGLAHAAAAEGLIAAFSLCNAPMTLDAAMREAPQLLAETARNILRTFRAGAATTNG